MSDKFRKGAILPLLLAAAGAQAGAAPKDPPLAAAAVEGVRLDPGNSESLPAVPEPRYVGPYRLLRELGTGGMGTVYLAESSEPLVRRVALKVIRESATSDELVARFDLERRALAAVDHDFVARLYDSGTAQDGRPWLAMEYVEGEPITDFCDRRRLDVEARLRLFVEVCEAVQHLHDRGVLHRDLKPANILVTERHGRAVPKIIDLGLARVSGRSTRMSGQSTDEAEGLVGTPAYMAPELFTHPPRTIDARCDVFSLGIVLRELLVGARLGGAGHGGMLDAAIRSLRSENPPPSAQMTKLDLAAPIARRRSTSVARLRRRLRGTLDRTAQRATETRQEARHASVAALAADLASDVDRHEASRRARRALLLTCVAAATGFVCGLLV